LGEFVKVAAASDIPQGKVKKVEVGDREVAIFNIKGKFYAVDDMCPHLGGPLSEGRRKGEVVTCPWHGWQFSLTDGTSVTQPSVTLRCYPIKVKENDLLIVCFP